MVRLPIEVKVYTIDGEHTIVDFAGLLATINTLAGQYGVLLFTTQFEGINISYNLTEGEDVTREHLGAVKPCYPTRAKIQGLQSLFGFVG